jgi:hypothetical protein
MPLHWTEVDRLAQAQQRIDPLASEADLWRHLKIWWCIKYQRPFKDPLLETYTLDELVYEYLVWYYRDPENDPAEKKQKEDQAKADQDWAVAMIKKHNSKKAEPEKAKEEPKAPPPNLPDLPDISTRFDE